MKIKTDFYTIPDQYGCNINKSSLNHGINQQSFPFSIIDIPTTANYLSWSLIDYDTIPLIGLPWIHWLSANCPVNKTQVLIASNFSKSSTIPQGRNSIDSIVQKLRHPLWKHSKFYLDLTNHYSGPHPMKGTHNYRLSVYATNSPLKLQVGFGLNELLNQINPIMVSETSLNLSYERRI